MWNLRPSSKITEERRIKESYKLHRDRVKSMKSLLRIKEPNQPDFVYAKSKLQLSRRQRQKQIYDHNQILLDKINFIKLANNQTTVLRPEAQNLTTLNHHLMNKINTQITEQNKRICQKLLKINSFYPRSVILHHTDQLEKVCQNISINARRAISANKRSSSLTRPQSGYTSQSTFRKNYQTLEKEEQRFGYSSYRPQSAPELKKIKKLFINNEGDVYQTLK